MLAKDLAGFPNGRRLADDVVDIAVQTVEGAAQSGNLVQALAAGDGVNQNDIAFGSAFPYVGLPHGASVNEGKSVASSAPTTGNAAGATSGKAATKNGSSNAALFVGLGVVVILAAGGATLLLRRKQA